MMRRFFFVLLIALSLQAGTILKPHATIDVEGNVVDMVVNGKLLYAATDAGKLEIYDWQTRKMVDQIAFKPIHDFMGDEMKPKVFGIDVDEGSKHLLIMVQDEGGERILYLKEVKGTLQRVLDKNDHLQMREARFVDHDHILLATMANELMLIELKDKKIRWRKQLSLSTFSDFQLNEDRSKVATTCESGIVYIVDVKSGKILKKLEGGNKDNVFKVDFKNYRVLTGGQDRKAVLYSLGYDAPIIYETSFLVYAVALNRDATVSAFQIDEQNDIGLYDNRTKSLRYKLVGQQSVLNNILFIDDHTLISSSDDNHINIWRIP